MRLLTQGLQVRDWQPDTDAEASISIYGNPQVTRWMGDRSLDTTVEAVKARLGRYRDLAAEFPGLGGWAVVRRDPQTVIGTLLLMPLPDRHYTPSGLTEIGWHFAPASWGQGYATEAAQAIMDYGFRVPKENAIYAVTLPENVASIRVIQRLAMKDLGITDDYYGGHALRWFARWAESDAPPR